MHHKQVKDISHFSAQQMDHIMILSAVTKANLISSLVGWLVGMPASSRHQ